MPQRVCEVCGKGFVQGPGRPARWCPEHRGKYGAPHQAIRAATLESAYGTPCVRCGRVMAEGQKIHLDHRDDGQGYAGFSHESCNTSAGASRGNRMRARRSANGQPQVRPPSLPPVPVLAARAPLPPCQFHVPSRADCPHSRDW
jgi:hypothetical protein